MTQSSPLLIGLSAVMVAVEADAPRVLITQRETGEDALPFGVFDPDRHRTFDLSLRGWVREQTGFELGYVEQLYTFGDKDRETPEATLAGTAPNARVISVGYLALTPKRARQVTLLRRAGNLGTDFSMGRPSQWQTRHHRCSYCAAPDDLGGGKRT